MWTRLGPHQLIVSITEYYYAWKDGDEFCKIMSDMLR